MATSRALCKNAGRFTSCSRSVRYYSAPSDGEIPQAKRKYVPSTGIYPKGFLAASAHVGIKASNTKYDDLALIVSETPCAAAGMFTNNRFKAAPVVVDKKILGPTQAANGIRAVVVNSGCANAVTGIGGIEDAQTMSDVTDSCLPAVEENPHPGRSSLVMSTGVIGQRLPISKIVSQIPSAVSSLGSSHRHWISVAKAICTTDTFPKLVSRQFSLPSFPGQEFCITGMAKGAGMIHPNMGTLLSIVCTDAPVEAESLGRALNRAVDKSFNSISIDGDTSTNDTILLLANGAAAVSDAPKGSVSKESPDFKAFATELTALCTELAQLVVRDGEGATKFVTIRVRGAQKPGSGKRIAGTIAKSPLVKTALYGKDANWGRILCAIGYAEGQDLEDEIIPEKVSVSFIPAHCDGNSAKGHELKLLVKGEPQQVDEERAAEMLAEEDLEIVVDLGAEPNLKSQEETVFWTCDFSHEYVTINGDYRT